MSVMMCAINARAFAAAQVPEPLTISQLHQMGVANLELTKVINYEQLNQVDDPTGINSFSSLEDQVNGLAGYDKLSATEPVDRHSKRVGLLGYKIGMTHFWDRWGVHRPCSVLQIDRCQVIQVKRKENQGIDSIQVGCGEQRLKKVKRPQVGHFLKYGLPPKKNLAEFPVTPENFLPIGYMLGPRHFKLGQFVDVQATSKGKGTAGVMKRWNFSGQEASHGNSKAHRLPGSIGMCEYPGKVFKGKKMAGHLGNVSATMLNQRVIRIDHQKSLLYILGNVPGPIGGVVRIRDAVKKIDRQVWDLYYPTFLGHEDMDTSESLWTWQGSDQDPFEQFIHENDVVSGTKDDD